MRTPLTKRQRAVFEFIAEQIRDTGIAPSIQEMCVRFGVTSLATIHKHLTYLEEKGYIKRHWNRARAIELLWQGGCCPTCGQVMPPAERAELSA